jgi:hypothetical protein
MDGLLRGTKNDRVSQRDFAVDQRRRRRTVNFLLRGDAEDPTKWGSTLNSRLLQRLN